MSEQPQDPRERQKIEMEADDRFLEAMLQERFRPRAERVDRSVAQLLSQITVRSRPRRRWAPISAAASILVTIGVIWFVLEPGAPSARAMFDRALEVALESVDRQYEVTLAELGNEREPARLQLDVRGGDAFRIEVLSGLWAGGQFGSDGQRMWMVPHIPQMPAMHGDVSEELHAWLDHRGVELPFLQIAAVLGQLEAGYDIEAIADDDEEQDDLIARRRGDTRGPHEVEITVRKIDGVVLRMTLRWHPNGDHKGGEVGFRLVDEVPRPSDWYEVSTHAADRLIMEFDQQSSKRGSDENVEGDEAKR